MQAIDAGDLPPETVRKIATELDVPEADVVDMNRRLAGPDHSLNTNPSSDGEGKRQGWLADQIDDQETRLAQREELGLRSKLLNCAIRRLNERERQIVNERHLRDDPITLEDLSQRFNISRERVRQIETRALGKLRDAIQKLASTRVGPLTVGARAIA
jgi:RNA polymerase sigma-32 factor